MNPQESFGCQVFSPRVMKEQLPSEVWERLEKATHLGGRLDPDIAQAGGCGPPSRPGATPPGTPPAPPL